jgi:signal transduction histidine kinase
MDKTLKNYSEEYSFALQHYLAQRQESNLECAYELGRKACAMGLGVLQVSKIHQEAMTRLLSASPGLATRPATLEAAGIFVLEVLSPFEATHRGFHEIHLKLLEMNRTLSQRNQDLSASNQSLQLEVAERKRTETALRESQEYYQVLFNEARQMQEDLRRLSAQILCVQEEERKRISRELHDEIGQALTAIHVHLTLATRQTGMGATSSTGGIGTALRLLEETMETVHRFARELRPHMIEDLGLIPTLRSYVTAFGERISLRTGFRACNSAEKIGDEQKAALYRVLQESLTNVAKHADAKQVMVTLRAIKRGICMEIKDDGKGFKIDSGPNRKRRLGLLGMQERIRLLQGEFAVHSKRGKGTTVRVRVPFQHIS